MDVRVLIDRIGLRSARPDLDERALEAAYVVPQASWLRANMVQTLDGAATGANGRSGSINNAADKRVFDTLRSLADAVVVGAGTARAEGYRPGRVPIVLVSRSGELPELLRVAPSSARILMVTCESAPALAETRSLLGEEDVLVLGDDSVELGRLRPTLQERGLASLLCEGGPSLLTALLAGGFVDELCATTVPVLVGGEHPRIVGGRDLERSAELRLLLEEDGTLLGRWFL